MVAVAAGEEGEIVGVVVAVAAAAAAAERTGGEIVGVVAAVAVAVAVTAAASAKEMASLTKHPCRNTALLTTIVMNPPFPNKTINCINGR